MESGLGRRDPDREEDGDGLPTTTYYLLLPTSY